MAFAFFAVFLCSMFAFAIYAILASGQSASSDNGCQSSQNQFGSVQFHKNTLEFNSLLMTRHGSPRLGGQSNP